MMGVPDSTSSQPSLQIVFSTKQNVNSNLSLVDEDGESVLEFNAIKSYQAVLFSDATLEIGKTYRIYQDDALLTEVTLSSHVTMIDEVGNARNAQQNGPGGGRPNPGSGGQMRPGI